MASGPGFSGHTENQEDLLQDLKHTSGTKERLEE